MKKHAFFLRFPKKEGYPPLSTDPYMATAYYPPIYIVYILSLRYNSRVNKLRKSYDTHEK